MVSNCADLTLSSFLYLTVRSPIWHYNYRNRNVVRKYDGVSVSCALFSIC